LVSRFFDPRRYDLAPVGRYKINKKLSLKNRLYGQTLAETLADPDTGEIIAKKDTVVNHEVMDKLAPYLDRDDFKMVTYQPSKEGVLPDPITVQEVKVYSKVTLNVKLS
jgi:DNA-directed RNA polymerase subunit beta